MCFQRVAYYRRCGENSDRCQAAFKTLDHFKANSISATTKSDLRKSLHLDDVHRFHNKKNCYVTSCDAHHLPKHTGSREVQSSCSLWGNTKTKNKNKTKKTKPAPGVKCHIATRTAPRGRWSAWVSYLKPCTSILPRSRLNRFHYLNYPALFSPPPHLGLLYHTVHPQQ